MVGFVSFNGAATSFNDTLIWASADNIQQLIDQVKTLEAYGAVSIPYFEN